MPDNDTLQFSAPIPGQSLGTELGSRPWERPSRYTTPEEALEYYYRKLVMPDTVKSLISVLAGGYPVADLVDALVVGGVLQGLHTIDVAIIIAPVLYELITSVADTADLNYKDGLGESEPMASTSIMQMAKKEPEAERILREAQDEDLENIKEAMSAGIMAQPPKEMEQEPLEPLEGEE
jgi:hypothetical protein